MTKKKISTSQFYTLVTAYSQQFMTRIMMNMMMMMKNQLVASNLFTLTPPKGGRRLKEKNKNEGQPQNFQ